MCFAAPPQVREVRGNGPAQRVDALPADPERIVCEMDLSEPPVPQARDLADDVLRGTVPHFPTPHVAGTAKKAVERAAPAGKYAAESVGWVQTIVLQNVRSGF